MSRAAARAGLLAILLLAGCASAGDADTSPAAGEASPPSVGTTPIPRGAARGPELLTRVASAGRPPQPAMAVRYEAALLADHCLDRDLPAPPASDIVMTVLDRSYALPSNYAPADLVPASAAGLTGSSGTKLVRSVLLDDLAAMHAAWQAAGLNVIVESGYRSYGAQAATFDSWVARLGYAEALVRSARPGHSEHQLGTSIDVSSPGWGGRFGDWGRETAEGAWMAAHAWEYGFVMSYPAGGQDRSCFGYEPWHYRWIGREAAAEHRERGGVLRDFLVNHVDG